MSINYHVKVPCSSANVGSGFDTLGIALNLYNEFTFNELDEEKLIIEGVDEKYCNKDNLVYQAMQYLFKKIGHTPKGLHIKEVNRIPIGRGLGSSSSCIVAGLVGANLMSREPFTQDELFQIAVEIEGHPDNVAPAFYGGLIASADNKGKTEIGISKVIGFDFYACVPPFELLTEKARKILPETYSRADAIFNISHALLTFVGLENGNADLVRYGLDDRIHEPYRSHLVPGFDLLKQNAQDLGALGAYLSGAGPTIMVVSESGNDIHKKLEQFVREQLPEWQLYKLSPDDKGCTYEITL